MSEMLKRLTEERQRIWDEAKTVLDAADAEKRDLSGEESEKFERCNDELNTLDKRIEVLYETEQRNRRAEEIRSGVEGLIRPEEGNTDPEALPANDFEAQVRSFLTPNGVKSLSVRSEKPIGSHEFRTLSRLTAAAGGNTVKTTFYNRVLQAMVEVSGLLQAGPTFIQTDTGEPIEIPKILTHPTASLVAETAVIPASDPTFGKATLGAFKYAVLAQISTELVTDTSFDIVGYLAQASGRAVGNDFGEDITTGNGTNKPSGLLNTTTAGVTGGTGVGGVPTADNLIDLVYSVPQFARNSPSASFLMRDTTLAVIRKIKNSNGDYIWQPSLQAGEPDQILGKAVRTDPNIPAIGLGAKSVVFGDISQYWVRQVNGIRFERSDEFAFSSDLVTFRCIVRGDGLNADMNGSIKHFVGGAS